MKSNVIYTADNLDVLRGMDGDSIDLIYMDPPFNKNKTFVDKKSDIAFDDAWKMGPEEEAWLEDISSLNSRLYDVVLASGSAGGSSYKAYSIYMAVRLLEMQRILKSTGSIYYHCDPTMSHSIKLVMDVVFGTANFRNEIIWHYSAGHSPKMDFKRKHDVIFRYTKTKSFIFNQPTMATLEPKRFNFTDDDGRKYRINHTRGKDGNYKRFYMSDGTPCDDVWTYVRERKFNSIGSTSKERMGYPTQKPLTLLDRIIKASSNKGDVVLDPFCGCATTCVSAQGLSRKWIGIDISSKATDMVEKRMQSQFGLTLPDNFRAKKLPNRSNDKLRSEDIVIKRRRYDEQDGMCNGCNRETRIGLMEIDHIIARAKGGPDIDSNIQLLCGTCNRIKGKGTMDNLHKKNRKNRQLRGVVTQDFCDRVMKVIKKRRTETRPYLIPTAK